jgi:pimeloyl-ACP methyl ester carboxylesterase
MAARSLHAVPTPVWRTVRLGQEQVRYLDAGTGDPFVFLHGWGLTPRAYQDSLTELCRAGVRVVAPALAGFGGSSPLPLREVGVDGYAIRVAAFLDRLGLDRPVFLAGHSLGGGVALRLASLRPDLVRSLTLVDAVGGSPGAGRRGEGMTSRPWWQWALGALAEVDPAAVPRALPSLVRDFLPNLARHPLTTLAGAWAAVTADLADDAHALVASELPVLFVWGDRDRLITPGAFDELESRLPPEVVPGRHGWLLTRPGEFAQLLHNALVVHAMLERAQRGQPAVREPDASLAALFPPERRARSRRSRSGRQAEG